MRICLYCNKELKGRVYKYCSNKCQADENYRKYIRKWKLGFVDGSRGIYAKNISAHISRYLLEKSEKKCSSCGWNKQNLITGRVPLEIDHIDGNSENNKEENLRLLCPNCHSLSPNFKNLNRGNGRSWRTNKYLKNKL